MFYFYYSTTGTDASNEYRLSGIETSNPSTHSWYKGETVKPLFFICIYSMYKHLDL